MKSGNAKLATVPAVHSAQKYVTQILRIKLVRIILDGKKLNKFEIPKNNSTTNENGIMT